MATFLLSKFRKAELDEQARASIDRALAYGLWATREGEIILASPGDLPFVRPSEPVGLDEMENKFGRQGLRPRPGSQLALACSK